jgi:hypothetical protein
VAEATGEHADFKVVAYDLLAARAAPADAALLARLADHARCAHACCVYDDAFGDIGTTLPGNIGVFQPSFPKMLPSSPNALVYLHVHARMSISCERVSTMMTSS